MNSRFGTHAGIAVSTAIMFWLDLTAGGELNLWAFYMFPVILASFAFGLVGGIVWSVISTVLLFLDGFLVGHPFSSNLIFVVNRALCGAGLMTVAMLATGLRAAFFDYFESRDGT